MPALAKLHTGQSKIGCLFAIDASNSIAVFIEQRHALFAPWQGVVPTVGLLPMPGRAMGLAARLLATSTARSRVIARFFGSQSGSAFDRRGPMGDNRLHR